MFAYCTETGQKSALHSSPCASVMTDSAEDSDYLKNYTRDRRLRFWGLFTSEKMTSCYLVASLVWDLLWQLLWLSEHLLYGSLRNRFHVFQCKIYRWKSPNLWIGRSANIKSLSLLFQRDGPERGFDFILHYFGKVHDNGRRPGVWASFYSACILWVLYTVSWLWWWIYTPYCICGNYHLHICFCFLSLYVDP